MQDTRQYLTSRTAPRIGAVKDAPPPTPCKSQTHAIISTRTARVPEVSPEALMRQPVYGTDSARPYQRKRNDRCPHKWPRKPQCGDLLWRQGKSSTTVTQRARIAHAYTTSFDLHAIDPALYAIDVDHVIALDTGIDRAPDAGIDCALSPSIGPTFDPSPAAILG